MIAGLGGRPGFIRRGLVLRACAEEFILVRAYRENGGWRVRVVRSGGRVAPLTATAIRFDPDIRDRAVRDGRVHGMRTAAGPSRRTRRIAADICVIERRRHLEAGAAHRASG